MIVDVFRLRYKDVPAAISTQEHFGETLLHNHEAIEILMIDKGMSTVRVGGENYSCSSGDLVFVNPMEVHSVIVNPAMDYKHRCVCFDASLISDKKIADDLQNGYLQLPRHIKDPVLFGFADSLFKTIEKEEKALDLEVPAYVSLMIARMIKNGFLKKQKSLSKSDKFSEEVLKYVQAHFCENISSKTAACALSYNQSYFCRRFFKNFGMSFSAYINMYRISVSKKFLESGNKKVSEVATECGFSDSMYFSKCFKKYVGILPSEYIKKSM